jgi:hypothetical protein
MTAAGSLSDSLSTASIDHNEDTFALIEEKSRADLNREDIVLGYETRSDHLETGDCSDNVLTYPCRYSRRHSSVN